MHLRLRLREHFNIVVNGAVRDPGGKDQRKTQTHTHTHTVNGPLDLDRVTPGGWVVLSQQPVTTHYVLMIAFCSYNHPVDMDFDSDWF